ncbi:MAG: iron-sulfur cluster assembly scaffold protein [Proteobacteria bacterium]|nr:iron-sulfur cluster assembly scaffold protein [Pseudomonadota bacterium]MBS0573635.1 iron-sulfur cluster assembly scaffold protein [Pseudomonadota bacterium]
MSETDLLRLYSERILALAADIPHAERLTGPTASATRRSPLCGSTVTVDLLVRDGRIADFGQEVRACALGQASAAIAGAQLVGRSEAEVTRARDELAAMLRENGPVPAAPFEGYEVLVPARDYRNRHASILLVLEAAAEAFARAH